MNDGNFPRTSPENDELSIVEDEGEIPPPELPTSVGSEPTWKIMVVDDDPDIHRATRLILKNVTFENKSLSLISARSTAEARAAIAAHPDTAVLLLDVVMETDDAGLELVKYIRKQLKNEFVRIILKTGYPGKAPESSAIIEYDINDYKMKVEMTQPKLMATVIFALRSYRDIVRLEGSRRALQELNQNLHLLVEERTRELTEHNRNLRREIDRRLTLERDLVESNTKFKGILDIAEEAIVAVGSDRRIILFNQGAERIFGYATTEVFGRPLDILLPEGLRQIHRQHVRNFGGNTTVACRMQGRREITGLRKNGEIFPAEVSISRLQLPTGVIYTAILQDISDRKRVEGALKRLNQELETRGADRTRQLQEKIEQQQRVERALRESEEKFRQFAETIREVFFTISQTGEIIYISPAYEEIWGRSCESLSRDPQSWFEAIEADSRAAVLKVFRTQIRRQKSFEIEYPIRRPDGDRRWIRARSFPIANEDGQIYRFAGIAEDITDRKQDRDELQARETALRELYQIAVASHLAFEQRLQALLSMGRLHFGLEVGILSCIRGDRYRVVAVQAPPNFPHPIRPDDVLPLQETFCRHTFQTPDPVGIIDATDREWNAHPARREWGLRSYLGVRILAGGEPYGTLSFSSPHPRRPFNGHELQLLQLIAMWVGNEIERQQSKAVLEQEFQKTLLQQQITDKIRESIESHQIVEATVSLVGEAFEVNRCLIYRYRGESDAGIATVAEYLTGAFESVLGVEVPLDGNPHLASLLESDRAIASDNVYADRLLEAQVDLCRRTDLKSMLGARTSYKGEPNGAIVVQQCDRFREWTDDEVRLRQILLNVVGNALKFTDSGSVTISVRARPDAGDVGPEGKSTVSIEIAVADTGIGIAPEQRRRIFESFMQSEGQSTRKYGGSGLGLAITRRLTEMLGGTIHLESEIGRGSTFTFVFPRVAEAEKPAEPDVPDSTDADFDRLQKSTILVVDDVRSNLDLIRGYFANSHHRLLSCQNGLEAIHQAKNYDPDPIRMDLRMPHLDGWEATKYLKENPETRAIPIVILTASSPDRDRREIADLHDGFLHKPVSRRQLFLALKRQLPERSVDSPPPLPPPEVVRDGPKTAPTAELLEKLRRQEETVWPELHKTLKMRDLQAFSDRLMEWARIYPHSPLVDYASTLNVQLQEFDWDKIPQTVKRFPDVRRAILELARP